MRLPANHVIPDGGGNSQVQAGFGFLWEESKLSQVLECRTHYILSDNHQAGIGARLLYNEALAAVDSHDVIVTSVRQFVVSSGFRIFSSVGARDRNVSRGAVGFR